MRGLDSAPAQRGSVDEPQCRHLGDDLCGGERFAAENAAQGVALVLARDQEHHGPARGERRHRKGDTWHERLQPCLRRHRPAPRFINRLHSGEERGGMPVRADAEQGDVEEGAARIEHARPVVPLQLAFIGKGAILWTRKIDRHGMNMAVWDFDLPTEYAVTGSRLLTLTVQR